MFDGKVLTSMKRHNTEMVDTEHNYSTIESVFLSNADSTIKNADINLNKLYWLEYVYALTPCQSGQICKRPCRTQYSKLVLHFAIQNVHWRLRIQFTNIHCYNSVCWNLPRLIVQSRINICGEIVSVIRLNESLRNEIFAMQVEVPQPYNVHYGTVWSSFSHGRCF